MTTLVWHVPGNRELDLSALSEADHRLVTGLRGAGELLCLESASGQGELRVEHVRGRYRAVHVGGDDGAEPGRCGGGPHEILPVTDEHRRRWDYWHRAGDDAGHPREVGRDLVGSGPQDVAIHGPVPTGVQVRASQVSSATARSRATRSRRAGWLPLWFTAAARSPSWFHRVPSVGSNRVSWDHLPPRKPRWRQGSSGWWRPGAGWTPSTAARSRDGGTARRPPEAGGAARLHPGPGGGGGPGRFPGSADARGKSGPPRGAGVLAPLRAADRQARLLPPRIPEQRRGTAGSAPLAREGGDVPQWCRRCDNRLLYLRPGRELCERCKSGTRDSVIRSG